IAGVLIAAGIYPAVAVLGITASYNQGLAAPTQSHRWSCAPSPVPPSRTSRHFPSARSVPSPMHDRG
ncbi:hypothetical protein ACWEJP_00005, partial [Streptomyces sp. NPDC004749]